MGLLVLTQLAWPVLSGLNWVLGLHLVHLSLNRCYDNLCNFMSGQSMLETCKISSKSPAHILEHYLWNLLVNKSILAFIPHFGSFLCRSWRSKLVVSDRQQDTPHLALCSSRVKVRTKVKWQLPDRISCTKVIPYIVLACELECVYHDILSCWRTEWSWLQVSSCHVARLGNFWIFFQKKMFMVLLSSMGLTESLIASYQHLSLFLSHRVSVDEVECPLPGSNLLQDQRLDP